MYQQTTINTEHDVVLKRMTIKLMRQRLESVLYSPEEAKQRAILAVIDTCDEIMYQDWDGR